jgi:hypothetical protein
MTPHTDHVTPPHLELLGAPEVRPFEEALADANKRWQDEVKRLRDREIERSVARD